MVKAFLFLLAIFIQVSPQFAREIRVVDAISLFPIEGCYVELLAPSRQRINGTTDVRGFVDLAIPNNYDPNSSRINLIPKDKYESKSINYFPEKIIYPLLPTPEQLNSFDPFHPKDSFSNIVVLIEWFVESANITLHSQFNPNNAPCTLPVDFNCDSSNNAIIFNANNTLNASFSFASFTLFIAHSSPYKSKIFLTGEAELYSFFQKENIIISLAYPQSVVEKEGNQSPYSFAPPTTSNEKVKYAIFLELSLCNGPKNVEIKVLNEYYGYQSEKSLVYKCGTPKSVIAASVVVPLIVILTIAGILIGLKVKRVLKLKEIESKQKKIPVITGVRVLEKISEGNFGDVYKGAWNESFVALKKLKDEDITEFQREATILFDIGAHPHVVQFYGLFSTKKESFIVMEFMAKGSLLSLLRSERDQFTFMDQLEAIIGACSGMSFLESKKILHRDLACRNLLVTKVDDKFRVKVSDFGLAKGLEKETYYKPSESKPIPVRWTAPEVLEQRGYFPASDVWAFGVTCWEILEFGKVPYNWLSNKEVSLAVPKGEILPRPDKCNERLWEIIVECFAESEKRPTFSNLLDRFQAFRNLFSGTFSRYESTAALMQTDGVRMKITQTIEIQPDSTVPKEYEETELSEVKKSSPSNEYSEAPN